MGAGAAKRRRMPAFVRGEVGRETDERDRERDEFSEGQRQDPQRQRERRERNLPRHAANRLSAAMATTHARNSRKLHSVAAARNGSAADGIIAATA